MEHLERLCPQNLHLRSSLDTMMLESSELELFELLGDMFVVLCLAESASDLRIVGFVWIEIVSTGYLEGDKREDAGLL